MILWCLWWNRNAVVHAGNTKSHYEILNWSASFLSEYRNSVSALSPPPVSPSPLLSSTWIPPPVNCLKLNTDAAITKGLNRAGLGAVIRDSKGKIVGALAKSVIGLFSAEIGELLALREGLLLANSLNLKLWAIEVDAYNVASCVSSEVTRLDDASCIITDIQSLCKDLGIDHCNHIPRKGNDVAHSLAKMALISSQEKTWLNTSLSCILSGF